MKTIKLLIVDDNANFRETIKQLLLSYSEIEVVGEAEDGEKAIESLQQLLPDVVLMDISMPKMDGLEVTRYIKERYPHIGVIILTIHGNKEYQIEAERAGAAGYLVKKDTSAKLLIGAIKSVYQKFQRSQS